MKNDDEDKKGPVMKVEEEFHQETAKRTVGGSRSRSMTDAFLTCYGFESPLKNSLFQRRYFDVEPHHPTEGAVFDNFDPKDIKSFYSEDQVKIIVTNTMATVIKAAVETKEIDPVVGMAMKSHFLTRMKVELAHEFPVAFYILGKKKEEKENG